MGVSKPVPSSMGGPSSSVGFEPDRKMESAPNTGPRLASSSSPTSHSYAWLKSGTMGFRERGVDSLRNDVMRSRPLTQLFTWVSDRVADETGLSNGNVATRVGVSMTPENRRPGSDGIGARIGFGSTRQYVAECIAREAEAQPVPMVTGVNELQCRQVMGDDDGGSIEWCSEFLMQPFPMFVVESGNIRRSRLSDISSRLGGISVFLDAHVLVVVHLSQRPCFLFEWDVRPEGASDESRPADDDT